MGRRRLLEALFGSVTICNYCMWFVSINFGFGKETRKKTDVFVHKNMDVMFNEPRIYDLQTFTTLKKTVYCTSTYVGFDATSPLTV